MRDALFQEDATLSKNLNLNGNLAVLHCAPKVGHASRLKWPAMLELSGTRPAIPYNMASHKVAPEI